MTHLPSASPPGEPARGFYCRGPASIVEFGGRWMLFYHVQGPSRYERRVCAENLEYGPDGSIRPVSMTAEDVRLPE